MVLLVLVLSVGAGAFVFLGSDMHRLNYIKQQLGDTYDVTFADDGAISESNVFSVTSSDGVGVIGTCNWKGKIETETYVHHYYGIVSAHRISDEIAACFDECVIVANNEYQHLWKQYIATDTLKSYDDYLASFEVSEGLYRRIIYG